MDYEGRLPTCGADTVHHISARNVNTALSDALWWLHVSGVVENSRNGKVLVAPAPVITTYRNPKECVLFSVKRNANPFFHFFEALWMLGGRNDVAFVAQFNSRMKEYSDDGEVFHSAYGYRWREWFGMDQLAEIVRILDNDVESRRAVLTMWDAVNDLHYAGKDLPCNTQVYFDRRRDVLNMTVVNRSNDAIWGCYGANAVHFSYLQQYVAMRLNTQVGLYHQFSNNLHVYMDLANFSDLVPTVDVEDFYATNSIHPFPLLGATEYARDWEQDLMMFLSAPGDDTAYVTKFFDQVVAPMYMAWTVRNDIGKALDAMEFVAAEDWRAAGTLWLSRRDAARQLKAGVQS